MTIYGECEAGGTRLAVTISGLEGAGCALDFAERPAPEGEMALWIGAIGPLGATATARDRSTAQAAFHDLLDPRILDHFAQG